MLLRLIPLILLIVSGCSTNAPTHFYVLSPAAQVVPEGQNSLEGDSETIGLEPIVIPQYLSRSEIVTRSSEHELTISDTHKWAEPLEDGMGRALVNDISPILTNKRLVLLPTTKKVGRRLKVNIDHFEREGDEVALVTSWYLKGAEIDRDLMQSSSVKSSCEAEGYPATVACMSAAVAQLSEKIASSLR